MQSHRRSQSPNLQVVGGTTSRRTRQSRSKPSVIDRLEERWRQRPEGHR
jgi:hypothetical protein